MDQTSNITVYDKKLINNQIAYLINKGAGEEWVTLFDATKNCIQAIILFETQLNEGPSYHPLIQIPNLRDQQTTQSKPFKYNLRERQIQTISMQEFYGINDVKQKKQGKEWNTKKQEQMLNVQKTAKREQNEGKKKEKRERKRKDALNIDKNESKKMRKRMKKELKIQKPIQILSDNEELSVIQKIQ